MMKSMFIIVTIVIFVVVLFVLNGRSVVAPVTTTTPSATPTLQTTPIKETNKLMAPQTLEIIISSNGLSSSNLSIKAGDTVTFVNNDSALHWPASGIHPTHQICLGFDALRGLKQGEKYSFTFEKAAVCPFHDHLNAGAAYKGSITVTE